MENYEALVRSFIEASTLWSTIILVLGITILTVLHFFFVSNKKVVVMKKIIIVATVCFVAAVLLLHFSKISDVSLGKGYEVVTEPVWCTWRPLSTHKGWTVSAIICPLHDNMYFSRWGVITADMPIRLECLVIEGQPTCSSTLWFAGVERP